MKFWLITRATLSVYFSLFTGIAFAQNQNLINAPIPTTPNAAAILKFVDMPVSHYTGVPQISIPLFNIKGKDLNLPISINYHASGLKANEVVGWVGSGWTLTGTGVIGRTIMDFPDNQSEGYYSDAMKMYYNSNGTPIEDTCAYYNGSLDPSGYHFYQDLNTQQSSGFTSFKDTEPDIFSFSLPNGKSGKFIFDLNKNIKFIPKSSVIITPNFGNGINDLAFTAYDIDGVSYEFDGSSIERVSSVSLCNNLSGGSSRLNDLMPISSWFLNKIKSSQSSEFIEFQYESEVTEYQTQISESRAFIVSAGGSNSGFDAVDYNCTNTTSVTGVRLSSILFNDYRVQFIEDTQVRADLNGGHRLKEVIVLYGLDTLKKFVFYHSYYGSFLQLDSLVEVGSANSRQPAYKFIYDRTNENPQRNSLNQDYWGFFNGADNNTLVPIYKSPVDQINFKGANRLPNFVHTKTGILKSIQYPTGGYTNYTYEPHTYSNIGVAFEQIENWREIIVNSNSSIDGLDYVDEEFFEIFEEKYVEIDVSACDIIGEGIPTDCGIELRRLDNGFYKQILNSDNERFILLQPGNYQLKGKININKVPIGELRAKISWIVNGEQIFEKSGGGLRIKEIQSFDGINLNPSLVKQFMYESEDGMSSGKLMDVPIHDYLMLFNNGYQSTNLSYCSDTQYFVSYKVIENSTLSSNIYNQGSPVCYGRVTESLEVSDTLVVGGTQNLPSYSSGKTVYEFLNLDLSQGVNVYPRLPQITYSYKNGILLKQSDYTNNGTLVKEVINKYQFLIPEKIYGFQATRSVNNACRTCDFQVSKYFHNSEGFVLDSTITKEYSGAQIFTTIEDFDNLYTIHAYGGDAFFTLQKKTNLDSKGNLWKTEFKFPADFLPDPVMGLMYSRNIQTPVLTFTTKNDTKVFSGSALIFESGPSTPNAPVRLSQYFELATVTGESYPLISSITDLHALPSSFELKQSISYDAAGNISGLTKPNNLNQSFLWDSQNFDYPIAQVENALLEQVYFTNFEGSNGVFDNSSRTGNKLYVGDYLFEPPVEKNFLPNSILSYWYFENGAWNYKQVNYSGGAILIVDGQKLDDLRIYPAGAMMTTYTHKPGVGVTSITDVNNKAQYYIYDEFNRLQYVKDDEGNILQYNKYHYIGQQD